ncbi:MAG: phage tail protein [Stappia sp.]|uniref:tail protein X n=1 Tax=Stappia sp. TaxID=1870903 RepID=UPI000C389E5E|nr:tail protein X [Stappia sp.]MAA97766.1 phage tail protein [Stappia sp.]MBM19997.1 phage tail protein [Stappia sp.]
MSDVTLPTARIRITREDASLEQICFEYAFQVLGDARRAARISGYVEAALEANRSIAATGLVLPLGVEVTLPEWRISGTVSQVRLWD